MPSHLWWVWMVLAGVFGIGELLTAGFFLLWFGVGAAVAGVLGYIGLGGWWQIVAFVVVSTVLFAASRRLAERWTQQQPSGVGADRFIGGRGVVLEEIDNVKGTGHVRVERDQWRADSDTGEVIPEGTLVEVVNMNGTHLVVKPVQEE